MPNSTQGVIRHIGLSNVSVDQLREAQEIIEIAAVTAQYNIGDRTGANLLTAAEDSGVVFSPWHPTTVADQGADAAHLREVLGPTPGLSGADCPSLVATSLSADAADPWHIEPRHFEENPFCRHDHAC